MAKFPLQIHRADNNAKAAVFLHGFTSDPDGTWGSFLQHLTGVESVKDWDLFALGYPTSGLPDFSGVWSADPDLPTLSRLIATRCRVTEIGKYDQIAFVAHSMGGLVVQRMLLENQDIAKRVSHLIMLGTPSNGLKKAGFVRYLKRQLRNMAHNSDFIVSLRREWGKRFPSFSETPFRLAVTAGASDQFVPIESCHEGFPDEARFVVQGDHLSMVKPDRSDSDSVCLVVAELCKGAGQDRTCLHSGGSYVDVMSFRERTLPLLNKSAHQLTPSKLVGNALDLERKGFPENAVALLHSSLLDEENLKRWTTSERCDVMGSLGGQLKRLWLADRESGENRSLGSHFNVKSNTAHVPLSKFCAKEAFDLYSQGLMISLLNDDPDQIYYQGINVAFMSLVHLDDYDLMQKAARIALDKAEGKDNFWAAATQAEAHLYLGNIEESLRRYGEAFSMESTPKNSDSTIIQAFVAAAELGNRDWVLRLDSILSPWADSDDQLRGISENEEDHEFPEVRV